MEVTGTLKKTTQCG